MALQFEIDTADAAKCLAEVAAALDKTDAALDKTAAAAAPAEKSLQSVGDSAARVTPQLQGMYDQLNKLADAGGKFANSGAMEAFQRMDSAMKAAEAGAGGFADTMSRIGQAAGLVGGIMMDVARGAGTALSALNPLHNVFASLEKILPGVGEAVTLIGFAKLAQEAAAAADNVERFQRSIGAFSKDANAGANALKFIEETAQRARLPVDDLLKSYGKLEPVLLGAGKTAEQSQKFFEDLTQSMRNMGQGAEGVDRFVQMMTRAIETGGVPLRMFKTYLTELHIPLDQLPADLRAVAEQAAGMGNTVRVGANDFLRLSEVFKQARPAADTLADGWTMVKNAMTGLLVVMGQAETGFGSTTHALESLAHALESQDVKNLASDLGSLIGLVIKLGAAVGELAVLWDSAMTRVGEGIGWLIGRVGGDAYNAFVKLGEAINGAGGWLKQFGVDVQAGADKLGVFESLVRAIGEGMEFVGQKLEDFTRKMPPAVQAVDEYGIAITKAGEETKVFKDVIGGVPAGIDPMTGEIKKAALELDNFTEAANRAVNAAAKLGTAGNPFRDYIPPAAIGDKMMQDYFNKYEKGGRGGDPLSKYDSYKYPTGDDPANNYYNKGQGSYYDMLHQMGYTDKQITTTGTGVFDKSTPREPNQTGIGPQENFGNEVGDAMTKALNNFNLGIGKEITDALNGSDLVDNLAVYAEQIANASNAEDVWAEIVQNGAETFDKGNRDLMDAITQLNTGIVDDVAATRADISATQYNTAAEVANTSAIVQDTAANLADAAAQSQPSQAGGGGAGNNDLPSNSGGGGGLDQTGANLGGEIPYMDVGGVVGRWGGRPGPALPGSAWDNARHFAAGGTTGIPIVAHDNEAIIPLSGGAVPVTLGGGLVQGMRDVQETVRQVGTLAHDDAQKIESLLTRVDLDCVKFLEMFNAQASFHQITATSTARIAAAIGIGEGGGMSGGGGEGNGIIKRGFYGTSNLGGYLPATSTNMYQSGPQWFDANGKQIQFAGAAEGLENTNFLHGMNAGGLPLTVHPDEAIVPLPDGRAIPVVFPGGKSPFAGSGAGVHTTVVQHFNITARDAKSFGSEHTQNQLAQAMGAHIRRAERVIGSSNEIDDPTVRLRG